MASFLNASAGGGMAVNGRGNLKPQFRVFVGKGGITKMSAVPNTLITFPISAECLRSNFFFADRFKVVSSLYNNPNQSMNFWADFDGINIIIEVMFVGITQWVQVFHGFADKLDFDLIKGTVTLSGRNFAGFLMDTAVVKQDTNTKIVDIIGKIAAAHGLTPEYGGHEPTEDYGNIVDKDKSNGALAYQTMDLTEWDMLCHFAKQLGRTVYEKGGKLFFVIGQAAGEKGNIWTCQAPKPVFQEGAPAAGIGGTTRLLPSNSIGLKVTHDFHFSQATSVMVTHHKPHVPETVTVEWPPKGTHPADADIRRFYAEIHSKSDEDALAFAKNYHQVANYREWLLEWKVAGPDLLEADVVDTVEVNSAEESQINGPYAVASIEIDISAARGFVQTIHGVWGRTEAKG